MNHTFRVLFYILLFCVGIVIISCGVKDKVAEDAGTDSGTEDAGTDGGCDCTEVNTCCDGCNAINEEGPCELDDVTCTVDWCRGGDCVQRFPCPIYVDDDADGATDWANDGTSWDDAFTVIQDGADAAETRNNPRVFVAEGTYLPPAMRAPVLTMKTGVWFYGGFAGIEDLVEERPPLDAGVVSTLDGDSDGTFNGAAVVIGASNASLDRFTVTNGLNNGSAMGGGMYNEGVSNLIISNVTFSDNLAYDPSYTAAGGGMYNTNSSPTLNHVVFSGNAASASSYAYGGGMYNYDSNPELTDVVFFNNSVTAEESGGSYAYGGGMYNYDANPELINVVFSNNLGTAYYVYGSGMYNTGSAPTLTNVTLTNVVFFGNTGSATVSTYGGGIYNNSNSTLNVSHGSFYQNAVSAIDNDGTAIIVNSVFYDNDDNDVIGGGTHNVTYTCNQQNMVGTGNQSLSSDPFVTGPDDELFLNQASLCVGTGDNDAADAAYGVIDDVSVWQTMTTDIDGALDTTSVDMGVHYLP